MSSGGKVRIRRYRSQINTLLCGKERHYVAKLIEKPPCAPKPEETSFEVEEIPQLVIQKSVPIKSNIFKNIIISPDDLKQRLPSYSKRDESNLKVKEIIWNNKISDPGHARRKKIPFHEGSAHQPNHQGEKMQETYLPKNLQKSGFCRCSATRPGHHLMWWQKFVASAHDFLKKREKEKKKAKSNILGNFETLKEALPALDKLIEENKPRTRKYDLQVSKSRFTSASQDAQMMEDLQTYQQVLSNPEYTADPFDTIAAQLRQRLQSGDL